MDLTARKYKLIEFITQTNDEAYLKVLTHYIERLEEIKNQRMWAELTQPISKTLDIEKLKKEQNYKKMTSEDFFKLVDEINIEEPLEELLSQLTK